MSTPRFLACFTLLTVASVFTLLCMQHVCEQVTATLRAWEAMPVMLHASVDALPAKLLPPVLATVDGAVQRADARLGQLTQTADRRTGEALSTAKKSLEVADQRTGEALAEVRALRADVTPVLRESAALVKDARESWDDSYWDMKALLASATVASTQTAQTMESVRAAVPGFLATGQQIAEQGRLISIQFTGIATDAHTFTTKFTAPRTTGQKIWEGVRLGALTAGRIF